MSAPTEGWARDQVALVTGGSRGIGRAVAERLSAAGARLMIAARNEASLRAAMGDISGESAYFVANAGDERAAAQCVDATIDRFGSLDILVNNAATNPYFGPLMGLDSSRANKTVAVNMVAPLLWTQLAWTAWMREHGGCVINVASIGGFTIEADIGFYNATKAALIHLTKQLASELGPMVRVNAVAPGLIKTEMAQVLVDTHGPELARTLPLRRLGEVVDIAEAVHFLASPGASWITGHTLVVDGGAMVAGAQEQADDRPTWGSDGTKQP